MNKHTPSRTMSITLPAALAVISAAFGCGGRPEAWSTAIEQPAVSFGLTGAVAVLDRPADRVVLLTAEPDQRLRTRSVATGRNITNAVALPDGSKLFVVSAGHRARLGDKETDQAPSLTVIDGAVDLDGKQPVSRRIDLGAVLTDPLSGLAVDPKGRWLVLYAGGGSSKAFVENPNELLILDLSRDVGTDNPAVHTLQSFGGRPVRLTFTGPLNLPVGRRELLVVESDQDLSILQLEMPKQSELTIPLTSGLDARRLQPAEIAVDDGDPARNDDARIGVRLQNDRTVITMQLEASAGGAGFKPTLNLTDVGGVPSDIDFVRTDGGLRLAALVPGTSSAVLIDPLTSLTTTVALPAPYARLSLVTGGGGTAAPAADVALLWSGGNGKEGIAFWALGQTAGQPYRSIETVGVAAAIDAVFDVPDPNQTLKVLKTLQDQRLLRAGPQAPNGCPAGDLDVQHRDDGLAEGRASMDFHAAGCGPGGGRSDQETPADLAAGAAGAGRSRDRAHRRQSSAGRRAQRGRGGGDGVRCRDRRRRYPPALCRRAAGRSLMRTKLFLCVMLVTLAVAGSARANEQRGHDWQGTIGLRAALIKDRGSIPSRSATLSRSCRWVCRA